MLVTFGTNELYIICRTQPLRSTRETKKSKHKPKQKKSKNKLKQIGRMRKKETPLFFVWPILRLIRANINLVRLDTLQREMPSLDILEPFHALLMLHVAETRTQGTSRDLRLRCLNHLHWDVPSDQIRGGFSNFGKPVGCWSSQGTLWNWVDA